MCLFPCHRRGVHAHSYTFPHLSPTSPNTNPVSFLTYGLNAPCRPGFPTQKEATVRTVRRKILTRRFRRISKWEIGDGGVDKFSSVLIVSLWCSVTSLLSPKQLEQNLSEPTFGINNHTVKRFVFRSVQDVPGLSLGLPKETELFFTDHHSTLGFE